MKRYYLIVLLILLPIVGYGYGNNIALEIISPKEATTGTPAIPATHRIFRAYPGLTYSAIDDADAFTGKVSLNAGTGLTRPASPLATANNAAVVDDAVLFLIYTGGVTATVDQILVDGSSFSEVCE